MSNYNGENLYLSPRAAYEKTLQYIDEGKMSVHTWHDKETGQFCRMPIFHEGKYEWDEGLPMYDAYLAALPVFTEKYSLEHQEVEDDDFAAALQRAAKGEKCEPSSKTTSGKSTGSPGPERQHTLPKQ